MALPAEADLCWTGPEWLLSIVARYSTDVVSNFLMLIWRCWNVRNAVLQAGEPISVAGSVAFLTRYLSSLSNIRQQAAPPTKKGKQKQFAEKDPGAIAVEPKGDCRWVPPDGDDIKVNVDGAFFTETGKAALGVIIRDRQGQHLLSAWRCLSHCRDAEEAEALACLEGVRLASKWPDRRVVLESDCITVVAKLHAGAKDRSLLAPIIHDTLQNAGMLKEVAFTKVGREQNKVAHELAHLAIRLNECRVSHTSPLRVFTL
jgi:ribonuclease HI